MDIVDELRKRNIAVFEADVIGLQSLERYSPLIPLDMIQMYRAIGGVADGSGLPYTIMSPTEIIDISRGLAQTEDAAYSNGVDRLFFCFDGSGDYVGVHLDGWLAGKVFIFNHEEPMDFPAFSSVGAFFKAMLNGFDEKEGCCGLENEYPLRSERCIDGDAYLVQKYLSDYYGDPEANCNSALYALRLLSFDSTEEAVKLMDADDEWVQEEACRVLGVRKYAPAVQKLNEIALKGKQNGKIASILALRKIATNEAKEILGQLAESLGEPYAPYFGQKSG